METLLETYIEHTALHPAVGQREIEKLLEEAIKFGFFGVCVPPFWVRKARRDLKASAVKLVTVAGFPFGHSLTATKMAEIAKAIEDGADEIDMVISITSLKSGMDHWAKAEVAQAAQLAHSNNCLLKIIIETAFLNSGEIKNACRLCADAGADFVKTSTGTATGATEAHVTLMRACLPESVGIKASGGIRTRQKALALIAAGAERIGTSNGMALLEKDPDGL